MRGFYARWSRLAHPSIHACTHSFIHSFVRRRRASSSSTAYYIARTHAPRRVFHFHPHIVGFVVVVVAEDAVAREVEREGTRVTSRE